VLAGEIDQVLAGVRLDIRRVDHGQPPGGEPLARDITQYVERVAGGGLIVLVVGDQATAVVRRDDLGRLEMLRGERGLARPGDSDHHHEGQLGDG
jgi:hypothetical protein